MKKSAVKRIIDTLPGWLSIPILHLSRYLTSSAYRSRCTVENELLNTVGRPTTVLAGVFSGMRFFRTLGSQGGYFSKITGSYELPVQQALVEVVSNSTALFVDVGAAEGYYAVGVARRFPAIEVVCFELEKNLRYSLRKLARLNGCGNIKIRGACSCSTLREVITKLPCVLLVDVEGYEDVLIDLQAVNELANCSLIVELHEEYSTGVTARLLERLRTTHQCRIVRADSDGEETTGIAHHGLEGRRNAGEWLVAEVINGRATGQGSRR